MARTTNCISSLPPPCCLANTFISFPELLDPKSRATKNLGMRLSEDPLQTPAGKMKLACFGKIIVMLPESVPMGVPINKKVGQNISAIHNITANYFCRV